MRLDEELKHMKIVLLALTAEWIADCSYCSGVSDEPDHPAPIRCTRLSGSTHPVAVNAAMCLSCDTIKACRTASSW